MKPWGRFIFVFIAYSIALLHTAVPHHHGVAGAGQFVFAHAGCSFTHSAGGLLQKALSTDLGVGHLETFKKNADTPMDFSASVDELAAFPGEAYSTGATKIAAVCKTAFFQR